jgi:uncharacterized protein YkwD
MNHGPRTFLAVAIACCVTALAGPAQASAACANEDLSPTADNVELVREALVCLHNEERQAAGSARLRPHAKLTASAQGHAEDMVARQYFSHDSLGGRDPFGRMRRAGYIGRGIVWNAGETIAWASGRYATPRAVMDAWMDSTSQRLTLLAPDFRDIGVGIAIGAPVERGPDASPATTFTIDYGWRTTATTLRACLKRAAKRRRAIRRLMRARCHGLARQGALKR